MNLLSYKTSKLNGLSFELLVDGKPLAEYVGFKHTAFPYKIVKIGIPIYRWTDEKIVAVCDCGEYGCDCVLCKVKISDHVVIFSDFRRERGSDLSQVEFKFSSDNFLDIESKIKSESDKKHKSFEKI
jgi:hypothetical protein